MTDLEKSVSQPNEEKKKFKIQAGIFLTSIAGIAGLAGFSKTIISTKKKDPQMFSKGVTGSIELAETGAQLALRALGWGTLYAFMGTGIFCFGVWKLSGASNMAEFREKVGSTLPKISKNSPPQSRTEFEGLTDLMTYITTWGKE